MFHLNCQRFYLKRVHPLQDGLPKSEYLHSLNLRPPLVLGKRWAFFFPPDSKNS